MGKLSFLGEVAPADLPDVLDAYVAGDFWTDERAMLEVRFDGERWLGLNDAVLARGQAARAVSIEVEVDGASVATYLCDGVVVSTATGSTAYSLAAGGPVLAPDLRCMVVTPIVPHLTALRSLVLTETARVGLWNRGYASTQLTVDGQIDLTMEPGHGVEVRIAAETARFARRGSRSDFYQGLAAKLSRG
jgi:NAD+ kinase